MKRGEMLKSEVAPANKSLCHESQTRVAMSCLRVFVIFRKLSKWLLKAPTMTGVRVLWPLDIQILRNFASFLHVAVSMLIMEGVI